MPQAVLETHPDALQQNSNFAAYIIKMPGRKLKNPELGRKSLAEFKASPKIPVVILLDNVRSFHNVGSVFRTADAFSVYQIIICGISPKPPHRSIHKVALGATESVEWNYFEDAIEAVKHYQANDFIPIVIEQCEGSIQLQDFDVDTKVKYLLIFGNEVDGVNSELVQLSSECIEIPQSGTKHSLNISVSAGVVAWKFYQAFMG